MRFLEKYCINSTVRLHDKEQAAYWADPTSALRDLDPKTNEVDQTIYNMIVPTKRRKENLMSMDLGSEVDYKDVNESDSDSENDRFGKFKQVPIINDLIRKWN